MDYEDIINCSPFILNHLISLKETHDYYLSQFIKNEIEADYVVVSLDECLDVAMKNNFNYV